MNKQKRIVRLEINEPGCGGKLYFDPEKVEYFYECNDSSDGVIVGFSGKEIHLDEPIEDIANCILGLDKGKDYTEYRRTIKEDEQEK